MGSKQNPRQFYVGRDFSVTILKIPKSAAKAAYVYIWEKVISKINLYTLI